MKNVNDKNLRNIISYLLVSMFILSTNAIAENRNVEKWFGMDLALVDNSADVVEVPSGTTEEANTTPVEGPPFRFTA